MALKVGVPSLLGRRGGRALFKDSFSDGFDGGSSLRCASSGGICTDGFEVDVAVAVCFDLSCVNLLREDGRGVSEPLLGGGAEAGFRGISFLDVVDRNPDGLTVEFDDDVDDSRTGGKPNRLGSPLSLVRLVIGGLLRVGLCCFSRGVAPLLVITTAGEYDDAELGVGT